VPHLGTLRAGTKQETSSTQRNNLKMKKHRAAVSKIDCSEFLQTTYVSNHVEDYKRSNVRRGGATDKHQGTNKTEHPAKHSTREESNNSVQNNRSQQPINLRANSLGIT
jgi:hypothetical protein